MRLHWFLASQRGAGVGRPGWMRRALGRIGPTWAASPLRRLVQAFCLVTFAGLFCYVTWPYTARPARTWHGWLPVEVDAETGGVKLATEASPAEPLVPEMLVHVVDAGAVDDGRLGLFAVRRVGEQELDLAPAEPLTPVQLDKLSASFGPWMLSEAEPGSWPSHYADSLQVKEKLPAELFLILDPLVSISTAIAARCWVGSLGAAGAILLACLLVPRGFCGYVCPLGTLVDLFDWAVGKRVKWFRVAAGGWWVHLKYYLLLATLIASLVGVLLAGFVAAIPVVTRAFAFLVTPLEMGLTRGWHQIPAMGAGHAASIGLFLVVVGLGLLRPRFWCKYVCPTGAVFSVGNLLRLTERKVESTCVRCKRCVEICPFDAIKPDFTTRTADCTFCQACGGVCPTHSIKFVERWNRVDLKAAGDPPTGETAIGRRGFLSTAVGTVAGAAGGAGLAAGVRLLDGQVGGSTARAIVRPPGSVPEREFLQLCVRCGECFQACPNDVLQPAGLAHGLESLWTPRVVADWSGCEPSCANCGQVCPTGAIRALSLEEKRVARIGLAVVNRETCLPHAAREDCRLCVDECAAAGYRAIEFVRVGAQRDPFGQPIEESGFFAPVVLPEACVGCGLCQTRCHAINVKAKGLLAESAILVEAGEGKEDRLMHGSYVALRQEERRQKEAEQRKLLERSGAESGYLPDFLD